MPTKDNIKCSVCILWNTTQCPYKSNTIPVDLQYGCYKYAPPPKEYNKTGKQTQCGRCRFLFRKPKIEAGDKSFIVCGCVPSMPQRIQPIPNCPHFKPIRRKLELKRRTKHKAPYNRNPITKELK